ncbi:MAG: hypothetical protein WC477_03440 [Patescibacteria group bacterium]
MTRLIKIIRIQNGETRYGLQTNPEKGEIQKATVFLKSDAEIAVLAKGSQPMAELYFTLQYHTLEIICLDRQMETWHSPQMIENLAYLTLMLYKDEGGRDKVMKCIVSNMTDGELLQKLHDEANLAVNVRDAVRGRLQVLKKSE